ncbi:MAG: adenylyltransferase/cytidyltransferase family protein [Agathobacter sp.]|uniref:adenylyltransferase/cytidyltransferase family protein n=1 Tax=Agathobacter sp. TaxID=2021311 RepID=UPI00258799B3|nr:adenylyltransferase/cytidyltransferase family protein [Agathobacter sp.]MCR5677788.1 adenylyltransferase/cytidyltransferase family protein [Agathobacter sp.]
MKKVITYGTFDMFHQGHYNIIKRAKEYGDYLIVGVTGDSYDVGRGKLSVHDSIATRINNVKNTGLADAIIVEEYLGQKISDIIKYDVDVFVIGDDWKGKFDHLKQYCEVVYLERTKNISSTQLREENFKHYNIGLIVDEPKDNQIIAEAQKVSGFKVSSVFSEDRKVLDEFQDKYDIENAYRNLDAFWKDTDIVFVKCHLDKRADYIEKCLKEGKHVIADPPFSLSAKEHARLFEIAKENHVALLDNVKMVYVRIFTQLLWMAHAGMIGDIIRFNCSISKRDRSIVNLFDDLTALALCPVIKIMGKDYQSIEPKVVQSEDGIEYASILLKYETGEASINIGNKIRVKEQLEIIGTEGTIRLKDNWWKSNYFELETIDGSDIKTYSMNFDGNGFCFLLSEMMTMLTNERTESMGLFPDESNTIVKVLEYIHQNV